MRKSQIKYFFILFLLSVKSVYASGILDAVILGYSNVTSTWSSTLLPVARYLFWFLAGLEFFYQISIKKLLPNDIQKLWIFLIVRMFCATFLAMFVLDLNFYTAIISWMAKLGASCGGETFTGGGATINYSPSALFDSIWSAYYPTLNGIILIAGAANYLNSSVALFLLGLCGMIIICILTMVFVVMLTLIEAYFVMFAGIILSGFAGSSWTMNYWQKYLSYVGGVAIRLFCTSLLLGLISTQMKNPSWIVPLPKLDPLSVTDYLGTFLTNIIAMLAIFGFNMILLVTIPSKAAAMLNGSVNAGLGEAIGAASMALSGGRMLASAGTGGFQAAAKAIQGVAGAGAAAKTAGFKAMRDGLRNNIGSDGGGSDDKWKSLIKQSGQDAAKNAATNSIKSGFSGGKEAATSAVANAKNHASAFAKNANSVSGPSAGASPINMDPHKH